MRTHGWSGVPPASDDEAVERIVAAAFGFVDAGREPTILDVARELGVTRQTVYRYFPSVEALLEAIAVRAVAQFLDRITAELAGIHDPATAVVEGIAVTLERLRADPRVGLVFAPHRSAAFAASVTSPTARAFGHSILERFDVDWAAAGFDDAGFDELVEHMLRILQSLIVDPGDPPRTGPQLRWYLRRWVAPAVACRAEPRHGSLSPYM